MASVAPKGEPVDFQVVSERWSTYKVKDKAPVTLKARVIVLKVLRTPEFNDVGEPVYVTGTGDVMLVTFAPPEIRGPPTIPPPTKQQIADSITSDLQFETVEEPWNEYKLEDGTVIRLKVVVTGVMRTSFFSPDGDPVYYVNHQKIGRMIVPPNLRRTKQVSSAGNQRIA